MARPTMLASASGELNTRAEPNLRWRLWVTLKTPPLPLILSRFSSRLQSATSSPKTTIRGSRAISSCRQAFKRSTIVLGSPRGAASLAKVVRGGIDVGGVHVSGGGRGIGEAGGEGGVGRR